MDIGSFSSSNSKDIYFLEDSLGNKCSRLANESHIILNSSTTDQPTKCTDLRLLEMYSFYESDFNWSSNQTTI